MYVSVCIVIYICLREKKKECCIYLFFVCSFFIFLILKDKVKLNQSNFFKFSFNTTSMTGPCQTNS